MFMLISLLIKFICAVIVVMVHEVPKVIVANYLMHPIHRGKNTISIKPLECIDPIGVIMFMFMHVGWQKPIEFNAKEFKDRKLGLMALGLTGLLSNILLLTIAIPILIAIPNSNTYLQVFFFYLMYFSLVITVINLLPVPPFDMTKIIYAISPTNYFKIIQFEKVIQVVFILLLIIGVIPNIINVFYIPIDMIIR